MELRLSRRADLIEGRLTLVSGRTDEHPSWEFVGWLAFVRAVEAAIAADPPAARERAQRTVDEPSGQ